MFQRSGDVPVGVPSNMMQYAALMLMLEQLTGYEAGVYYHTISDAHIYADQVDKVRVLLERPRAAAAAHRLTDDGPGGHRHPRLPGRALRAQRLRAAPRAQNPRRRLRPRMSLYNFHAARDDEQLAYMESLEDRGVCLFCRPVLLNDPLQSVSYVGTHWSVVANRYPYVGTKSHQLLVPAEHVRAMHELSPAARAASSRPSTSSSSATGSATTASGSATATRR